jgi:hypothetical protein
VPSGESTTARKWWALEQTKKTHTPGPWFVSASRSIDTHRDGRYGTICETYSWMGIEEANANESLIAASPDLLKAVELAHEFFINPHKFNPLDVERTYEAAIRKARGAA